MSNSVLPVLVGLKWDVLQAPAFKTGVHEAVSGKEVTFQFMQYPNWEFETSYEVLRADSVNLELQKLCGFFLQHGGRFDSWLYPNPRDNSVTDYQFALRDGTTIKFQLTRSFGAGGFTFVEPVQNVNVLTNIKSNGVAISNPADYTIDTLGVVTLTAAGTPGHALTWTGTYYYRCRFLNDTAEFREFMRDLYELKKLTFRSVKR